jgi:uncharacterized protein YkwD
MIANHFVRHCACALLISLVSVCPTSRAENSDAAQRAQVKKLLDDYSNSKSTFDQREKDVTALLDAGEEGPRRLLPVLVREMKTKEPAYLTRFERAAQETLAARLKTEPGADQEITTLRRQVLGVSRGGNVTKEAIVSTCDPAIKKLNDLLSVAPEQVFEHDPKLKDQREELGKLRSWWEQAAAKLPESKRDPVPRPPDEKTLEDALHDAEALSATFAMPMTSADRATLLANRAAAAKIEAPEAAGVAVLNTIRIELGIGALAIDPKLCQAGRGHSTDMKERKFFDHTSPVPGKETPWKRAKLAGTSADAENIAEGTNSPEGVIQMWWHSPGHHVNMMAAHKRVGLGKYDVYWTQMFGD